MGGGTAVFLLATTLVAAVAAAQGPTGSIACRPEGALARVADLPEASGVAPGRSNPTVAWAHNDSGQGGLIGLDPHGMVIARVAVTGAALDDWEALAAGPCPGGNCLYLGDIGDNDMERRRITIYRVAEPAAGETSVVVRDRFHATYPDGAHDAETLLVTPKGELFIVTKGNTGPIALYRIPPGAQPGTTVRLERVGKPRTSGRVKGDDAITDGAVSPDGSRVVLRTNTMLQFFDAAELLGRATWRETGRVDLRRIGEPQGEGVAFANNRTLILTGEGGGGKRPGTIVRMACTF
jgi:hypothetical protein